MRKVLLTVVSAALMGASTLSGAVVPNAFAQEQAEVRLTAEQLDALEVEVAALEGTVSEVCVTGSDECLALIQQISTIMATLVANERLSGAQAELRLAAVVDDIQDPQVAAVIQEQLFVDTAATPGGGEVGGTGAVGGTGGDGGSGAGGGAVVPASPS